MIRTAGRTPDSTFPQFHRGTGGPAGGCQSSGLAFEKRLAQFSAVSGRTSGRYDGISTPNAIFLTTKAGLEAGNRITVNIRAVTLKPHGTENRHRPGSHNGPLAVMPSRRPRLRRLLRLTLTTQTSHFSVNLPMAVGSPIRSGLPQPARFRKDCTLDATRSGGRA